MSAATRPAFNTNPTLRISLHDKHDQWKTLGVNFENGSFEQLMTLAKVAALGTISIPADQLKNAFLSGDMKEDYDTPPHSYYNQLQEDIDVKAVDEGDKMADFGRDELNAHLAKNKAEVDSVAAEMRREMAEWRTEQTQVLMSLKSEITAINVKLDERFEAQKRSSSLLQWLAGIILAFVALIPAFQGAFNDKKEVQTQPIVVQIPQQTQNPSQK